MPSGTCTWTYHPPVGKQKGYWTVVDNCTSGSCATALRAADGTAQKAPAGFRVDSDEFAAKVKAEYLARGAAPSPEQSRMLDAPQVGDDYVMDCV